MLTLEFAAPSGKDIHAEVMDWADDVAYAVHDIEDYYRNQLIPLHDYRNGVASTKDSFWSFAEARLGGSEEGSVVSLGREAVEGVFLTFPSTQFRGSQDEFQALDNMRSALITQFLAFMSLDSQGRLVIDPVVRAINSILKELTWFHVIQSPELSMVQRGQRAVLGRLVERMSELVVEDIDRYYNLIIDQQNGEAPALRAIPSRLRRYLWLGWKFNSYYTREQGAMRAIIDWVASLTEGQAYHMDEMLHGRAEHSGIGSVLLIG